ncbi:nickel transporter permease [Advenella sp. RU8]|uniref:ABC transporter permease n=1 Tax=Advenella alkanexedens TaxID=1481665 RepID=A0ABS6NRF4_9BURK|nr:nickel transporter permease [Advenella alkanexedens]MBV4397781.1 ABC transporter permease [Advenella alkanexedens]
MNSWLLSETPASRFQATCGQLYVIFLSFIRNPLAVIGLLIVLTLVICAFAAPYIATHDPYTQSLNDRLLAPSSEHWLGTDHLGRDIWSRIVYGSRSTLTVIVTVAIIVGPIGLLVGILAGFSGGLIDRILMRITDIFLAFPRLILALAFTAVLEPGLYSAIIAIAITSWPAYARLARAETMIHKNADFIQAIKLQGASTLRILYGHIAPLCLPSIIVRLTLDMAGIILIAAGLGFLGLGAQPPLAEWGSMIASGRDYLLDHWWIATIPGIAICIVSLGFNILGDGLRDVLDPKTR